MKKRTVARSKSQTGKLLVAGAVCLLLFSGISDTLAINTYVRDLKGLAIPVQTFHVDQKVVALTFDVRNDEDQVAQILLQLREEKTKATFFLTGEWIQRHRSLARAIVRDGHEVGRSLYSDRDASQLSLEELREELRKTDQAWTDAQLPEGKLFRAPHGETSRQIAKEIRTRHEQLIAWSIDAAPVAEETTAAAWSALKAALSPGEIIRLRADEITAKGLTELIGQIRDAGYQAHTISTLQAEVL